MAEYLRRVRLRRGSPVDILALANINADAIATIRDLGVPVPLRTPEEFKTFCDRVLTNGILRIAETHDGVAVGFIAATLHVRWLHLEELAVSRLWRQRGCGSLLLETYFADGKAAGCIGFTLTTDKYLPFNEPVYRRRGFYPCASSTCPDHLRRILRSERASAHFPDRRIGMVRQA